MEGRNLFRLGPMEFKVSLRHKIGDRHIVDGDWFHESRKEVEIEANLSVFPREDH